jgi:hypothetical protein
MVDTVETATEGGVNPTTPAGSTAPVTTPSSLLGGDANAPQQTSTEVPPGTTDGSNAAPAVPEAYEYKLPEGVTLDADVTGELSGLARDFGLTQEQAQKVADLGAKMSQKWATGQTDALEAAATQWAAATTSDAEIGGAKLDASLAAGQKALKELGTPELSKLLNESRLGNHPEVIRFFARVGQKVSEDGFVAGTAGAPSRPNDPKRLYPRSNMNP